MKERPSRFCPDYCLFEKGNCPVACKHLSDVEEDYTIYEKRGRSGEIIEHKVLGSNPNFGGELYLDNGSIIHHKNPRFSLDGVIFQYEKPK
jgi:hypothetical protein